MPINTFATFMVPMAQDKAYLLIFSFIKDLSQSLNGSLYYLPISLPFSSNRGSNDEADGTVSSTEAILSFSCIA